MASHIRVGIDLGTTNICVCVYDPQKQTKTVLVFPNGSKLLKSVVLFKDNTLEFGQEVPGIVYQVKRFMGAEFDDSCVQESIGSLNYTVVRKPDGTIGIPVTFRGKKQDLSPTEVSALMLHYVKRCVCKSMGISVTAQVPAVITVPAFFPEDAITATDEAAKTAGFTVIRLVKEPTAAAVAYDLRPGAVKGNVLVFDLGGVDFDKKMVELVLLLWLEEDPESFVEYWGDDHPTGAFEQSKLRFACIRKKEELSNKQKVTLDLESVLGEQGLPVVEITQEAFKDACEDLFDRCKDALQDVLRQRGVSAATLVRALVIGGASRTPGVLEAFKAVLPSIPIESDIDPKEVVAIGACAIACDSKGMVDTVTDVVAHDIGVIMLDGNDKPYIQTLVPRNTTLPFSDSLPCSTCRDNQTEINMPFFEDEKFLKESEVGGLPPMPRKFVRIGLIYTLDVNGVLHMDVELQEPTEKALAKDLRVETSRRNPAKPTDAHIVDEFFSES